MMLGKTSLKMVSQEVVQTEFSVVHGLTRMHGLTRNEDTLYGFYYCDVRCYKHKGVKYRVFKVATFENLPIFCEGIVE